MTIMFFIKTSLAHIVILVIDKVNAAQVRGIIFKIDIVKTLSYDEKTLKFNMEENFEGS